MVTVQFSLFHFTFNGEVVLVFELGCCTTKNECINTWSMRDIKSAIESSNDGLSLIIGCYIFWNVMNRSAKIEL